MKKIRLIFMVTAVCLLSGCLDKSYRGLIDTDLNYDPSIPIPIWIQIGEPYKTKLEAWSGANTKGVGIVEDNKVFTKSPFYVLAFNQDKLTSMETTSQDNPGRCLIDASIDYANSSISGYLDRNEYHPLGGRRAWYDLEKQYAVWYDPADIAYNEDMYWPMGENKPNRYDFFAYYIDDIKPTNVTRTESSVIVDIEIDGSQDVMSAVAMPSEEKLKAIFPKEEDHLQMIEYKYYYCYGYYSALKTLNPEFVFDHHLVRLEFYITPGETKGYTNSITVHDISVQSKSKAEFTVASTNVDKDSGSGLGLAFDRESVVTMYLRNKNGSMYADAPLVFDTYPETDDKTDDEKVKYQVGGSLLVAPTSDSDVGGIGYHIEVTLSEVRTYPPSAENPDGKTVEYGKYTNKIYLQNPSGNPTSKIPRPFQAGNFYQVNMTVSGHKDILISGGIDGWVEDGGYFEHDTDIRPGT